MRFDAITKRLGFAETGIPTRPARRAPLSLALAAACFLAPAGALAQQTVIIGGGPAPSAAVGTIGSGVGGVVVNESVLDSLGPGAPAAGLPLAAPQTPVYGSGIAAPVTQGLSAVPGPGAVGAYRLPGTGQLVVTRPSTLLYPPLEAPKSRLAVTHPGGAAKPEPARAEPAGTAAAPGGKLTSRLIAAPPKSRPAAAAATPTAAEPAKAARMPEVPAAASETARTAAAPAKPSVPPPPSLLAKTKEAAESRAAAAPDSAEPAPGAQVPEPAPGAQAPSAQAPTVPPPAPEVPVVAAPKVTAPADPAAPAKAAAETTVAAIPPAEDRPALRAPGAAAAGPGGDLRLTFASGSAELSDAAKNLLLDLAQNLSLKPSERVQLLAFAADDGGGASRARRLSLSRALAVRAFLIDQGVRSTRMDVRALGSKVGDGPADRVDIQPQ